MQKLLPLKDCFSVFEFASQSFLILRKEVEKASADRDKLISELLALGPETFDFMPDSGSRHSRGAFTTMELENGLKLQLRGYRRGGLIQRVLKESYFWPAIGGLSSTRPGFELGVGDYLFRNGASVVEPVAAIVQKSTCFYRAVLFTKFAERTENFLLRVKRAPGQERLKEAELIAKEALSISKLGVLHRDLHLGNALIRRDGTPLIIDFDRAELTGGSINLLSAKRFLSERWTRSIKRHQLDLNLSDAFTRGLEG